MLNVLITGASSGIGKAVKDLFLKNGHNVYAIDIAKMENEPNLHSYAADISNKDSLNIIKNDLINQNLKLDYIINIAGIHIMASLVEADYDKIKKIIDVNLSGTILVNNIFHSLLTNKGRIIIVTSEVASFDPMPFNGIYSVTKVALETYAQALRQELNLLGQKVITFRPGAVETPLCNSSVSGTQQLVESTILFKRQASKFLKIVKTFMGKPIKPEKMALFIYKKSLKKHPKLVYKKHQNFGLVLLSILPKRWQCGIIKLLLNFNTKKTESI